MGPLSIPEHFRDVSVGQITRKPLQDALLRYGRDFWTAASKGVAPMFLGPPSVYKSYAAAALCKALHERACVHVGWCTVPVMLNQLERKRFDKATDRQIEDWKQVPFLVMDDFAMIRMDTWQYNAMVEIAMARFDAGKPTCWTGNVEITGKPTLQAVEEALRTGLGTQLTRRLLERSEGYRVYVL
jgi:DNA replication protein DnaC